MNTRQKALIAGLALVMTGIYFAMEAWRWRGNEQASLPIMMIAAAPPFLVGLGFLFYWSRMKPPAD